MVLRRTLRRMLVALALTAGTAALCASAPAETMVSPDLHIVAKSQGLQQKKTGGGFISTLRASAVSLGKSLVQNVTRAIAKQSPRQNHLVRCVVRTSQRAARYRTLFRLPAVDAVLHKRESLIYSLYIPERQPLIRYISLPQSRSASADTPLNPIIFLAGGARKLYALHYNAGYVPAVAISQGGPQLQPVTGSPRCVNGIMQPRNGDYPQRWLLQSHSKGALVAAGGSSHWLQQARLGGQTHMKIWARVAATHFAIDPIKPAELLAYGAMGARNALRRDRSRDNRAQSV